MQRTRQISSGVVLCQYYELAAAWELAHLLGDLERRLKTTQLCEFITTVS